MVAGHRGGPIACEEEPGFLFLVRGATIDPGSGEKVAAASLMTVL